MDYHWRGGIPIYVQVVFLIVACLALGGIFIYADVQDRKESERLEQIAEEYRRDEAARAAESRKDEAARAAESRKDEAARTAQSRKDETAGAEKSNMGIHKIEADNIPAPDQADSFEYSLSAGTGRETAGKGDGVDTEWSIASGSDSSVDIGWEIASESDSSI